MSPLVRRIGQVGLVLVGYGLLVAAVAAPVAVEQAIERVHFEDRLGSLPVEVSMSHNGVSTFDTGILGKVYWDRTGTAGFGAQVRATGTPEAGGTLSSYVTPAFLRANAQFVDDPGEVARAYGAEMRAQVVRGVLWFELLAGLLGGVALTLLTRARGPFPNRAWSRRRRWGLAAGCALVTVGLSLVATQQLFKHWQGNTRVQTTYPMPGVEELSFSSPQTLEVARQIEPFIKKNRDRVEARAVDYREAADAFLQVEVPAHLDGLAPREGERIVLAEADPQGSLVGTQVRTSLYVLLEEQLGDDAIALRTISGDVTSNGTVAEEGFVRDEANASPDIPVVAVKGDHDSETTLEQLEDHDVTVPDFDVVEIDGLRVTVANDPAFKTLFGGLVTNDSGVTERETGEKLRDEVEQDEPLIVLFHQPASAAGYLGIDSADDLRAGEGRETTPWDDGIPDLPPGSVNVGHLHDVDGPWVVWNTDSDVVTWTVVSQLGTAGGVEESPTFNRFSTPFSVPLKALSIQLQYVDTESGLQTGFAAIDIATNGSAIISDRVDLGLPGGQPMSIDEIG